MSIANSSNCFESTGLGALVIKHEASFTLGKAITYLMLCSFAMCITNLSSP